MYNVYVEAQITQMQFECAHPPTQPHKPSEDFII